VGLPEASPLTTHPNHFTAKRAKTYEVSTAWAQRLDQNVPVCATFFLQPFLWIWGDLFARLARFAVQMHFLG
jgi:hypothetical protein